MDLLHSLLVAMHLLGMALLVGTFFAQMRANRGHNFTIMLTGASIQLITGVALYGMAMAGDGEVNHMKLGVKTLIAIIVLVAALMGFLRQRKLVATTAGTTGESIGESAERALKPFFHAAGGFAVINMLIAVLWH